MGKDHDFAEMVLYHLRGKAIEMSRAGRGCGDCAKPIMECFECGKILSDADYNKGTGMAIAITLVENLAKNLEEEQTNDGKTSWCVRIEDGADCAFEVEACVRMVGLDADFDGNEIDSADEDGMIKLCEELDRNGIQRSPLHSWEGSWREV